MRHFMFILSISIFVLSCDQTNNKEKEQLKEKELQVKVDSLNPTKVKSNSPQKKETEINTHISSKYNKQAEILNKWLWETIGCDFPLDSNTLKRANFNTMKYYESNKVHMRQAKKTRDQTQKQKQKQKQNRDEKQK